ncbi:DMT family transporter [Niallia sp. 03091]|uniref:DMT family transporter n=1 Tax=unclassified Niallia TaxID=2837522 RepID=UPI0040443990
MKSYYADLVLIIITMVWGISFPFMRNVNDDISTNVYLFFRFLMATIALFILFGNKLTFKNKMLHVKSLILGALLFGTIYFTAESLKFTTGANVSFLTGLNVILIPIVSFFIFKMKLKKVFFVSSILSVIGVFFLAGGAQFSLNKGDCLAIIAAFIITFQIIFIDKYSKTEDTLQLGVFQIFYATFFSAICLLFNIQTGESEFIKPTISVILVILFTGVFSTALAFCSQVIVQRYTSSVKTALIFTLEPVFGVIFSISIPNKEGIREALSSSGVLGCILIFLSILIAEGENIQKIVKVRIKKHKAI